MGFKTSTDLANTTVPTESTGGIPTNVVTISANTLLDSSHESVYLNVVDGCSTISLPPAASQLDIVYYIHVDESYAARALTVDPNGSELVGRMVTYYMGPSAYLQIRSNGVSWDVLAATFSIVSNSDDLTIEMVKEDRIVTSPDDSGEHIGDHSATVEDLAKSMNSVVGHDTRTGDFTAFAPNSYYCDLLSESSATLENSANAPRQRIIITVAEESLYGLTLNSQGSATTVGNIDYYLPAGSMIDLESNGSNWLVVSKVNVYVADTPDFDKWVDIPDTDAFGGTINSMVADTNNRVVVVGGGNNVQVSTDGGLTYSTPTITNPDSGSWTYAAEANGVFILLGLDGGTNNIATSSDLINWTLYSDASFSSVISVTGAGAAGFVLLDYDGAFNNTYFSSDGQSWAQTGQLAPTSFWDNMVGSPNGDVVVMASSYSGDALMIAYSDDPLSGYNYTSLPSIRGQKPLSYAGGRFMTSTDNDAGQNEIAVSVDGSSWTNLIGLSDHAVVFTQDIVNGLIIGGSTPSKLVYSSDNGFSWTLVTDIPASLTSWTKAAATNIGSILGSANPTGPNYLINMSSISSPRPILSDGVEPFTAPPIVPSYLVAALPAGTEAMLAYASDGRKNGELVGVGTGVVVFYDGTDWVACDSGQAVLS